MQKCLYKIYRGKDGYFHYGLIDKEQSFSNMGIKTKTRIPTGECIYRIRNTNDGPNGMKLEIMFPENSEKYMGKHILTQIVPLSITFDNRGIFGSILDYDGSFTAGAYFFYRNDLLSGIDIYIPPTMAGSFYDITISKRKVKISNFKFLGCQKVNFILQTVEATVSDQKYSKTFYYFTPLVFEGTNEFSYRDELMIGGVNFSLEFSIILEESPMISVNIFTVDESGRKNFPEDFSITGALQLYGKSNEITFDISEVPDFLFDAVAPNGVTQIFKPVKSVNEIYRGVEEPASTKVYEYLVDIVKTSETVNEITVGEIRTRVHPYNKIADIVYKQIDGSETIKKAGLLQIFCNTDTTKGLKAFKVRFITHNPDSSTGELEIVHIEFAQGFKSFLDKQKIVGDSSLRTAYTEHEWYLLPED